MQDANVIIKAAKEEILEDISKGLAPKVAHFSDLHDYVDANEYGLDEFHTQFPDANFGELIEIMDFVQSELNAWIKAGFTEEAK